MTKCYPSSNSAFRYPFVDVCIVLVGKQLFPLFTLFAGSFHLHVCEHITYGFHIRRGVLLSWKNNDILFPFLPHFGPFCSHFVTTLFPFLPHLGFLLPLCSHSCHTCSRYVPTLFPFLPHFEVLGPTLFPLCSHSCPTLGFFVPTPTLFPFLSHFEVLGPTLFPLCSHCCPTLRFLAPLCFTTETWVGTVAKAGRHTFPNTSEKRALN